GSFFKGLDWDSGGTQFSNGSRDKHRQFGQSMENSCGRFWKPRASRFHRRSEREPELVPPRPPPCLLSPHVRLEYLATRTCGGGTESQTSGQVHRFNTFRGERPILT